MSTSGHNSKGKFAPGNPGGPGRPRRAVERDYLVALSEKVPLDRWQAVVDKALSQAEGGDAKARDWLARYLLGFRAPSLEGLDAQEADPLTLDKPGDLLAILGEQIDAVRGAPTTTADRARSIGQLAGIALKAFELNQLAQRVEAL